MKLFILLCMVSTVAFIYDVPTGIHVFKYGLCLIVVLRLFKFVYSLLKPKLPELVFVTADDYEGGDKYLVDPMNYNIAGVYDPTHQLRDGSADIPADW